MRASLFRRAAAPALVVGAVTLAVPAVAALAAPSGAKVAGASRAQVAAAAPQQTVTAERITRPPMTLAPGASVRSSTVVGQRVFTDGSHGFALVSVGQAQYPAATANGGKTWHTNGSALHLNAAQAPLAVVDIGAAGRRTVFAYGSGQVIDATGDGGKHWYRALFQGLPLAVVQNPLGHLVAFVDGSTPSSGSSGVTWQYVSKNGGRTWRFTTTVGGS